MTIRERALNELMHLIDEVLETSEFAWWEWDIPSNIVTASERKTGMLGYRAEDFKGAGYQVYTDLLHPEDYERTMQAMRDHLEGRARIYQIDYRIRRADGAYTWYMDRGAIIARSPGGRPLRLRGLVVDLGQDLNESARDEAMFGLIRAALPDLKKCGGIATVCGACKKLKVEDETWVKIDASFQKAFPSSISHGICPDCARLLYPEFF